MKYNPNAKKPKDVKHLFEITNKVFSTDLMTQSRKRNNVNARMTFAYLLKQKGYNWPQIGGFMNRDHSTVIYYVKRLKPCIKTDRLFKNYFDIIEKNFLSFCSPVNEMELKELKKEILICRSTIKDLLLEIENLKLKHSKSKINENRVSNLLNIVKQRTPIGTEKETEDKLNRWYNGL